MPRKKVDINPKWAENLKRVLKDQGLTQKELASKIYISQQQISKIMNGKAPLTEGTADAIRKAFPRYRKAWLLGFDDHEQFEDLYLDRMSQRITVDHIASLIEEVGYHLFATDVFTEGTDKEETSTTEDAGVPLASWYSILTSDDAYMLIRYLENDIPLPRSIKPLATISIADVFALGKRIENYTRWEIQKLTGEWE